MPTVEDMYNMVPSDVVAEARRNGLSDSMMRSALAKGDLVSGFDPVVGAPTSNTVKSVDFQEVMQAMADRKYYGNKPKQAVEADNAKPKTTYMM